ncbi:uncharacterized protein LOC118513411 isoform X2 [Anopheles stephensi]|uniref:uncharacterized protein LOC118513411 isoform X2 n=1 Tax=Anopheles stephensi TaxID=30069 RepID=UPI001658B283|nr:uncharacterized protein LOC118513411 isoform X2 [Anopheles stephensi]
MATLPPLPGPPNAAARERHHHHHRRRAHGLYFHSSPPKVLQMNNHLAAKDNDYRSRDAIKPSNIRIWLHHKQMSKLAKVLWAGQGMRLRTETSHHPRMKRFLECVPHVMGVIKDIHQAVIDNDLDVLKEKTAPPAPRVILTSKDANGLTPLHKAAGLAHTQIVEYILSVWPSLSSDEDHTGKTPLHWAASAKNNARSFNLLVQAGADETALDDRHKPAEHYKNKPSDIDRSLLSVIPEAPRISQQGFPAYFDWAMFTLPDDSDEGSQPTRMKPFLSQNNLLDAETPEEGAGVADTVSKSKSVHNLTNGVLTELGRDEQQSNGVESTEEKQIEQGEVVDDKPKEENDTEQEAALSEKEDNREEATEEKDGTVVEHNEEISVQPPDAAETDAPVVSNDKVDGDGDDQAQETQQTESDRGEAEGMSEHNDEPDITDSAEVKENGHLDAPEDEPQVSRNSSAREAKVTGSAKSNEIDRASDTEIEQEDNPSPVALEEAEVSKDSLEQVLAKDDEIELDSLGKDLEPEELVTGGDRGPSAASAKGSLKTPDSQSGSRVTTGKSIKSTITVEEQAGVEEPISRKSSAAVVSNGLTPSNGVDGHSEPEDTPDVNDLENRDELTSGKSGRHRTYPNSAKESITSTSRPPTGTDAPLEAMSRVASSTLTPTTRPSGNRSSHSSTKSRKASIGSQKSVTSTASSATRAKTVNQEDGDGDDDGDDSEANDDSNNADVQIASYRTPDEKSTTTRLESAASVREQDPANQPTSAQQILEESTEPSNEADTATQPTAKSVSPKSANGTELSSQVLEIEGTVQGEPDQGQLQSQNEPAVELNEQPNIQQTVQDAIDAADLEQLAAIVLNGEGKQLIGRKSEQSEIQAFLDNVPAYMGKIRRVHLAAREGSLRDLQSALDRRKFATAKDEVSPHGATPLHVATIFGHAGIVRYLAGRFPETLSATDDDGRTPLHYAATLKDNGHFYNLLTHLGANPKVEDNLNHSAEYYLGHVQSQGILSHRQLLRDYGAKEELADEMLNDQELGEQQVEIPLFRTEEGRYLATSLGDPLIKGLTEKSKTVRKESDNDTNNNFIEGSVKQAAEKELESSSKQTIQPEPVQGTVAPAQPMESNARDENQPSPDEPDLVPAPSDDRDEHGQSMLHFACARSHGRNALIQLIEESGTNITYRDELYRTARDVALQATQPDNAKEIDRYLIGLVAKGDLDALNGMLLEGYDHIMDVVAPDGTTIEQVASSRGHQDIVRFLEGIRTFEENRENLLGAIRQKKFEAVVNLSKLPDGAKLVRAKNYYGRCSLHIAILMENEDIVDYLASNFKAALKIGDNLERTPLHYAMGVSNVEALSRILIKNGAKRVLKDLKGRQPSYYFMNKADILRLQEEEKE